MSRLRRVLHASDFSRASRAAFARAVSMAKDDRAELLLVHVLAPAVPMTGDGYLTPKVYEEIATSARRYAGRQLDALAARARKAGARARTLLIDGGITDQQIIRAARSKKADVIVIGTHGRTGLAKMFLGSVASRVIAGARCPVLTIRGR